MPPLPPRRAPRPPLLTQLGFPLLLGVAVGLACWPLNLLDRAQNLLLRQLPTWSSSWGPLSLALALSPLLVMPLLLVLLQERIWGDAAGSGIPQTLASLEDAAQAELLLGPGTTLRRLLLWSIATVALFPLGREGPVVQLGAAVAQALRQRWPALGPSLAGRDALAIAAAAGLAGGFNTPLTGILFLAEELCNRFQAALIWPGLLVCVIAAEVSNIGGQPLFALGVQRSSPGEWLQLLAAVPLGIGAGLAGALFSRLLLESSYRIGPLARRLPLRTGLVLGALLAALMLLSRGASGGAGESLMVLLIQQPHTNQATLTTLLVRLVGPCLALGAGVPGGLIDPVLSIGAVLGKMMGGLLQLGPFSLPLGMAAAMAGALQLPVISAAFVLRLAGDQQLLPGLVLAAVLGAYASRLLLEQSPYRALLHLSRAPAASQPPAA